MNRPFAAFCKKQGALSSVMPQAQPDGSFFICQSRGAAKYRRAWYGEQTAGGAIPPAVMPETQ